MHHGNTTAASAALYDYQVGSSGAGDNVDAFTARWLQSAGLQHLASPLTSTDQRMLPNLLMQGYAPQTVEEKQKLYRILKNLNFNGDSGPEHYAPKAHALGGTVATDTFYSPDLRGEFGAGLLDLHSMDDNELLSEHMISEPFEPSPFVPHKGLDDDFDAITSWQQRGQADTNARSSVNDKDATLKDSNVAKIKVVVRKRPLNKKEISRKEDDIVTVHDNAVLTVHEPKLKVDLTAYVEKHEFCFDAVLDENVTNDEVYRITVEPIIPTIFQRTKATCFAYGQTGSGKTYTMQPLPLRAAEDIVRLLHQPHYRNQKFHLWLSFFEIYGGKLFDLLSDRRKLLMREDGRQQVCIVGLQEFEVYDVRMVKEFIEKGNAARSTGSTGANEESSRSHAILQLAIKKHKEVTDTRRRNDGNELNVGKVVGKISFIDLAGSERGADTTDNDRQTRIEGAEINKSLLALKECIRALDNDQIHIPFRGSKLTEVLRDSFVGNSKTVMISCISPNAGSCEHTLNTLRYADRVKSLSKSGNNQKKDQVSAPLPPMALSSSSYPYESEDLYEENQDFVPPEIPKKAPETLLFNSAPESERYPALLTNYISNGREEGVLVPGLIEKERVDFRNTYVGTSSQRIYSTTPQVPNNQEEEKIPKLPLPRRKVSRDEKPEKQPNWSKKDNGPDLPAPSHKHQQTFDSRLGNATAKQYEQETLSPDGEINLILEEEEALVSAHRKEIETTMEIVREEMNLLAEVDQPGSLIDNYVSQLSFLLSRKAAGLVSLQARLARFQHRLEEQEILSRKKAPR